MPLSPLARISLALGGVVLFTGAIAALAHDDWFAAVFLAGLGMASMLATFTGRDARQSASPRESPSHQRSEVRNADGTHTPPTVPWRDDDAPV